MRVEPIAGSRRAPAPLARPQAVIFDMDGLLLDTEVLAARAWDEAAAAHGATFDRDLALRLVGRNFRDCIGLVRAHYDADYPVDAVLGCWHATYDAIVARDGVKVKRGAHELLEWLDAQGIPRAVATSTRRERAAEKLRDAGLLARMHALVGGNEIARGKPAPDIYLEAARRLGVTAGACCVLEDSEPGVRGALAAGMTAIMVPDIAPPTEELLALGPHVLGALNEVHERWRAASSARAVESSP